MAERQTLNDAIGISRRDVLAFAQSAAALRVLGLQQVALASVRTQHFAARGDLKALGNRLLGLDPFWASHNRFSVKEREI